MTQPASDTPAFEPLGSRAPCAVKLPVFEGPLDLLLHLCRANEVDPTDLPIALISEQYLDYLDLMRQLDLDIAAEYLLMAASLAHIKSRLLLPNPEGLDDEDGVDPRAELARRLAEYAVFQEAARDLGDRPRLGRDVFTGSADRSHVPEKDAELAVSLFALVDAMQRVLSSLPEDQRHHEVQRESFTLRDRMVFVMDYLSRLGGRSVLFEDLLADGAPSRSRVVVTFLALLELAKIQALVLFQNLGDGNAPSGPVRVRAAVDDAPSRAEISAAAERAEEELAERSSHDAPELEATRTDQEEDG